ncbi:Iron transport multicopper oxidase FET3 [Cladophialophora carrionii]|uniref:Iron transport multicopper oxidase FET3 n=1 Tax=Cladophialophora carrionii TaxID=86049 RepID=A0A1C1CNQ6_9EURO|nr:Iron transport multicopper oxidase FET3 [Cladophialophora carrionii]
MTLSLSYFLVICAASFFSFSSAATRVYNFTAGWVTANPDGQFERATIGINGQWPLPRIEADVGDRVIVNLKNDLGNQSTSIHFHGLFMNGTNHMDGVGSGTQCPVPPGATFTYDFNITQPGTYWYHSHVDGQYPDGMRGPLIIHDPENPYADLFDEELVLTLSDWYHEQMRTLVKQFMSVTNPTGAEPVPQAALMNDTQNLQIPMQPGRTYFIRIINMAAFAAQYFWIEGHTFRIIEVDGVYHEPTEASQIYITAAQRYGILLTARNDTTENFAIVGSMDQDLFDVIPDGLNPNVTSFLVYDAEKPMPTPQFIDEFDPFDDMTLVPTDGKELLEDPDLVVQLDVLMDNLGDGANYAFFSGVTYVRPKVPSLYTALSTGDLAVDPLVYGVNTNAYILGHQQTIEIVVNNHDPGKHPFHLHGHEFQAIIRGDDDSGDYDANAVMNGSVVLPRRPMRRDTLLVRPNGHIVMRFKSDNPGVWLFHCHIEWHVDSGLVMTFVEQPLVLQETLPSRIPADHYAACAAMEPPMPTLGNAAGNTENFYDLTGANVSPDPLPDGFETKGIVAMTFSILAGLLGVGTVIWYGLGEMGTIETEREKRKIAAIAKERGVVGMTNTGSSGVAEAANGRTAGQGEEISRAG